MKKFLYKCWSKFLTAFGDIRFFKYPLFFVYDPTLFSVHGDIILQLMEVLEPGDILIRGWDSYLDSSFIKGDYSHAGIYIGSNKVIHAVAPKVVETTIIDFATCDRICVIRPKKYNKKAVTLAKKFCKDNIPYDFNFAINDSNALFCFELAVKSYPKIKFPIFKISKLFGLIKKEVYYADSFRLCEDAEVIFEYNPKRCIHFWK